MTCIYKDEYNTLSTDVQVSESLSAHQNLNILLIYYSIWAKIHYIYEQNNIYAFKQIFIDQFDFAVNTYF